MTLTYHLLRLPTLQMDLLEGEEEGEVEMDEAATEVEVYLVVGVKLHLEEQWTLVVQIKQGVPQQGEQVMVGVQIQQGELLVHLEECLVEEGLTEEQLIEEPVEEQAQEVPPMEMEWLMEEVEIQPAMVEVQPNG